MGFPLATVFVRKFVTNIHILLNVSIFQSLPRVYIIFSTALIWFAAIAVGLVLLLSQPLRYLSTYLILTSTLGFCCSWIPYFLVLFVGSFSADIAVLVEIGRALVMLVPGGLFGLSVGTKLARKLNRRLGWNDEV